MVKLLRAALAAVVLVLSSAVPVVALADVPGIALSVAASADRDCTEAKADDGSAADVAIKAKLLLALCKDNAFVAAGLAFVAGLLTSLSPCVYPLIPITISIFGARAATTKLKAFTLSALYVLGMSVLYTGLGVTFASLGMVSGSLMAVPWVVMVIGIVCVAMAASMFGAFEITLPSSLQTRLSSAGGHGYQGAFVMGLAAGIIAAPCTGPVLAVILSLISKSQAPGLGAVLMGAYSLGMGTLFLVLGTFSSAISSLPKSGRWMEAVKSVLGLAMIAAAIYLVKPHVGWLQGIGASLGGMANAGTVALVLVVTGIAVGALHLSFKDEEMARKVRKGAGIVVTSIGLFTAMGWVEGAPASTTAASSTGATWFSEHDAALAEGKKLGRPVMMDFGADWCAACKELERITYKDAQVQKEMGRFVLAKIDSTEMSPQLTELWKRYGITGLPVVVFFDSSGKVLDDPRVDGFLEPNDYLKELRKVR